MTTPVFVAASAYTNNFSFTVNTTTVHGSAVDFFGGNQPSNRCVLVFMWTTFDTLTTFTGCTYAGNAMTQVNGFDSGLSAFYNWRVYAIVGDSNIPTGGQDVIATYATDNNSLHGSILVASFSGVDGSSISSIVSSSSEGHHGSNMTPSWSITGASGDLNVAMGGWEASTQTLTAGTGDTVDYASGTGMASSWNAFVLESAGTGSANTVSGTISGSGISWVGVGMNLPAAAAGATTITLSGPGSGTINVASSNFTAGVDSTPITGTVIVTPATNLTGTFSPSTVSLTTGSPTATFTFTPTAVGSHTITTTNNGGLGNSTPRTFIAASLYTPYNGPAIFQPTVAQ